MLRNADKPVAKILAYKRRVKHILKPDSTDEVFKSGFSYCERDMDGLVVGYSNIEDAMSDDKDPNSTFRPCKNCLKRYALFRPK